MMEFEKAAKEFGTPLYLYDFGAMQQQYESLKEAFSARKSLVAFAIKSNANLSVVKHFAKMGAGADCVSIGEVRRALLAGVAPYKIIFSGVGKRDDEIIEALKADILFLNIESEAEMAHIEQCAKSIGKVARISVRVNPNIDAQTHPYISTGLHDNKFGCDIERAKRIYIDAKNSDFLEPIGIHFHIGSQLTELAPIIEASAIVADLVRSLKAIKIDIKFFDIGGGIGVRYFDEETIDLEAYAQGILSTLTGLDVTIMCEPGRFLTANAGYFITKVLYEKHNAQKRFVIVDGAMNDLIRPSLYQAFHEVETLKHEEPVTVADIVGPVCESGDFLAKDVYLPSLQSGDLIILKSAGAYGFGMGSNYNTRNRSAEVALENGAMRLIRKRESFEDLVALELPYLDATSSDASEKESLS